MRMGKYKACYEFIIQMIARIKAEKPSEMPTIGPLNAKHIVTMGVVCMA